MCLARDKRFNLTSGLESEDSIIITKSYCKVVLNQRAKRILVFGLWQEVQFDIWTWKCRKWIIITKSYFRLVLNQRANRIHVFGLWQEVQFDIWTWKSRTWIITTNSYWKVVLNQRANGILHSANKIHVFGVWQEVQFDIWSWTWKCRFNYHYKFILQSSFESKS